MSPNPNVSINNKTTIEGRIRLMTPLPPNSIVPINNKPNIEERTRPIFPPNLEVRNRNEKNTESNLNVPNPNTSLRQDEHQRNRSWLKRN